MDLPDSYVETCSNEALDNLILKRRELARNLEKDLKLIIGEIVQSLVLAEVAQRERIKREDSRPALVKDRTSAA